MSDVHAICVCPRDAYDPTRLSAYRDRGASILYHRTGSIVLQVWLVHRRWRCDKSEELRNDMYQPYFDITEKLGVPLWWDENGVPRYKEFHPSMSADIYADFVALQEIHCQSCGERFECCASWSLVKACSTGAPQERLDLVWDETGKKATPKSGLPSVDGPGFVCFGDAPWHGTQQCSGTTMTTHTSKVLQFWKRASMEWVRDSAYELAWAEEE